MTYPALTYPLETRPRQPIFTLAAALLLIVLLGSLLLAVALRDGRPAPSAGAPGSPNPSGAIQGRGTATMPPTLIPSSIPWAENMMGTPTIVPPGTNNALATPIPIELIPPTVIPGGQVLPSSVQLSGIRYETQTWNNSGPANLGMALSYWGWPGDQIKAGNWLRPHPENDDKSVSAAQMVYYVNHFTDYRAVYRIGGTTQLMKQLLAAGYPVLVQTSIQPENEDWMGHHQLLMGYDDASAHFLTYDSFLGYNQGDGRPVPYSVFDESWRHFSRAYLVVYDPAREMGLWATLGEYADPAAAAHSALDAARTAASLNRDDPWAWFSMGTAYVALKEYDNAVIAYDEAFRLGLPWRTLWYQFGPLEAYFHTGAYDNVLALADSTLATTEYVEEMYFWKAMVYAAEGDPDAAGEQFANVARYNRNYFLPMIDPAGMGAPSLWSYTQIYMEISPTLPPTATPTPTPTPTRTPTPTFTPTSSMTPTPTTAQPGG